MKSFLPNKLFGRWTAGNFSNSFLYQNLCWEMNTLQDPLDPIHTNGPQFTWRKKITNMLKYHVQMLDLCLGWMKVFIPNGIVTLATKSLMKKEMSQCRMVWSL